MKYIYFTLILVFVLFALVQYNDPDPLIWIPVYLIPAYLCYYRLQNKPDKVLYFLLGLVYFLWALNQFPPHWEGLMIEHLSMKTINVELGRESLGLGCCALGIWFCLVDLKGRLNKI